MFLKRNNVLITSRDPIPIDPTTPNPIDPLTLTLSLDLAQQFLFAFDKGERLHSAVTFENFGTFIDTDLAPPKNS